MGKIRIAIAGVGNCAAALLEGIELYRTLDPKEAIGLMHWDMGGYTPGDIEVVAAFDVDARKVNRSLREAILSAPNCIYPIYRDLPDWPVRVLMGPVLDGVAAHMKDYPPGRTFVVADEKPVPVARVLQETGAEILLNYLPVGSQKATEYYAEACLEAGVSLINCIPVFIVSNPEWASRFEQAGIPCVGDDVKSQLGATILHRTLTQLCVDRGVRIDRMYQLNVGGNTDFLNMLERSRLKSKKISKTEAVTSLVPYDLGWENIHIGPSDYVPWLNDEKICFIRIEGRIFGHVPISMDVRLSVQDSPNSAGVVIDAIRYCRIARDRGLKGPLYDISAYTMKHPPVQMRDEEARQRIEAFLRQR